MKKFRDGDMVIIKPKVDVNLLRDVFPNFTPEMDKYIGTVGVIANETSADDVYTVCSVTHDNYNRNGYAYLNDWLEPYGINEVTVVEED